jgi:hypothetical protein
MQKRHFEEIAEIINKMPAFAASLRSQKRSCANSFADAFEKKYPNFKRQVFMKACGEDCE